VRTLCTLWKRGNVSEPPPETPLEQASGPGPKREEEGERVLQQHSRASTWPKAQRFTQSPVALPLQAEQLQHAIESAEATTEAPLAPRHGALLREGIASFDGGRSRSMVPAQPHHAHCLPMALSMPVTAKLLLHAMWLRFKWCPPREQQASVTSALSFMLFRLLGN
jgi:hypothetical protein